MSDKDMSDKEEIFSKVLRAGRRTYFFDVRSTKAGDYYLTVTESKKYTNDDNSYHYKKHKIYLYKEDFVGFKDCLEEATDFIVAERGEEVISEKHVKDFNPAQEENNTEVEADQELVKAERFTNVEFDDI